MSGQLLSKLMKTYLRRGLMKKIRYIFMDAPFSSLIGQEKISQWYSEPLDLDALTEELPFEYTLDYIEKSIKKYNISVLMGFSQGGNAVDTYLRSRDDPRIKAAVIASGYTFECFNLDEQASIIPILIIASPEDQIVPYSNTPEFPHSKTLDHHGGHKVPTTRSMIRAVEEFIILHTGAIPIPKETTACSEKV